MTPPRQDRYQIVERIGAGGMGEVYLARHDAPILRCLAKDPASRPRSVGEALAAIGSVATPEPATKSRWLGLAIAAGALLAGGIVAAVLSRSSGEPLAVVLDAPLLEVATGHDAVKAPDDVTAPVADARLAVAPPTPDAVVTAVPSDARRVQRPVGPVIRITVTQASAYDDLAALTRALLPLRRAFATCYVPDAPKRIFVALKVTAHTGIPTGGASSVVPETARKIGDCVAQVARRINFGMAKRELSSPPTNVIVELVRR